MMNRKGTILCAAVLGVLLLAAAGCGSGNKSAANTNQGSTGHIGTTGTSGATGTTGGTGATGGTGTTAAGLGGLASAANCLQLSSLGSQLSSAFTGANHNIQKQAALIQQFAARTPSDIRPDFETLASAYAKIATALKGVNLSSGRPSAAVLAKLASLSTQINQAAVAKAAKNISNWASQNCHA